MTDPTSLAARVDEALEWFVPDDRYHDAIERMIAAAKAHDLAAYFAAEVDAHAVRQLQATRDLMFARPDFQAIMKALAADWQRLRERERVLTEALTPSGATKSAYIGEHKCDHVRDGDEPHLISWSVVKDIMAMIRARAALAPEPKT